MDRRNFLKVIFSSSLAAPLLARAKTLEPSLCIYLISDDPQKFLSSIIRELKRRAWVKEGHFTFLNQHPFEKELKGMLSQNGWKFALKASASSLCLSFEPLRHAAAPSFTLVKGGRVWDIRTQDLSRLWKEMNSRGVPSTSLTVASFKQKSLSPAPGDSVAIYADGKRRESLPLRRNQTRRFTTAHGEVYVGIEEGKARIIASTCRHKICVSSPPACLSGERIVCAPNRFLLEVKGSRFIDAVTG